MYRSKRINSTDEFNLEHGCRYLPTVILLYIHIMLFEQKFRRYNNNYVIFCD